MTRRVAMFVVIAVAVGSPLVGQDAIDTSPGVNLDPAGGGTIVGVEGNIVQISISLDVLVPEPFEGAEPLGQAWFDRITDGVVRAREYWNDRLRAQLAGNCFPIELSTSTRFVAPGESSAGGGHDVRLHPFYWPLFVTPQAETQTSTDDTAGVFSTNGTAYFPYWVFGNARALAHELGHVMGLGDEYFRDADGNEVSLPGRENSLMGGPGGEIDQPLVDRLGNLADHSGKDIPLCLSGLWVDDNNGLDTCIVQTRAEIAGDYLEERQCDHGDGTGAVSTTMTNIRGVLEGRSITGTTTSCHYGFESGNGYKDVPMTLVVSDDRNALNGSWRNDSDDEDVEFNFTRKTFGSCATE